MAENDPSESPSDEAAREQQRLADYARLVGLKRSAEQARITAQAGDYYAGAWDPWRRLVEEYQAALSAHVKEYGGGRVEIEQAILQAAKQPEGTEPAES